jgi:hypothetical protein
MGKLVIKDDCLAPARYIYLEYSGKDPYGVSKKITSTLMQFFHVSASKVCEEDFRWDVSRDPIGFFAKWWVRKELSNYSEAFFRIKFQGAKTKQTNEGNFTMQLQGALNTSFKYSTPLLKSLWWIYSYFFYNKVRRRYVRMCGDLLYSLRDEIKEHFDLEVAGPRAAGGP